MITLNLPTRAEERANANSSRGISLRQLISGWIGLSLIAALAWSLLITPERAMPNGPGTMGISFPSFILVWVIMMTAMMFPSVAPMALMWIRTLSTRLRFQDRAIGITLFLSGYLFAWTTFGAVVYVALIGTGRLANDSPVVARWVGVGIFALAGVYQLTPLKRACLSHCRSPLGSLFHYASYKGRTRDLRVGIHHGIYCVGCCWGLMIVLIAVGSMNIPTMIALTGVIFIEKVWRYGEIVSRVVGVALLIMAALVPFVPSLLPGLIVTRMTGM